MRGLQQEFKRVPHAYKEIHGTALARKGWEVTLYPDIGEPVQCPRGDSLTAAIKNAQEVVASQFPGRVL